MLTGLLPSHLTSTAELPISYWRTSTGLEVDFILGDMEIAIEIKASQKVHEADTKSLIVLREEHTVKKSIIVSFETKPRKLDNNIESLPWQLFLEKLWNRKLIY